MPVDRSLWVDDQYAKTCRECEARFTFWRRKHHCRQCGQVFCSSCLQALATPLIPSPQKVCCRCSNISQHQASALSQSLEYSPVRAPSVSLSQTWQGLPLERSLSSESLTASPPRALEESTNDTIAPTSGNAKLSFCNGNETVSTGRIPAEEQDGLPTVGVRGNENAIEQSIAYTAFEQPLIERNTMSRWLHQQKTDALMAASTLTKAVIADARNDHTPTNTTELQPYATFTSRNRAGGEEDLFCTTFDELNHPTREAVQAQCSLHLMKRVRYLLSLSGETQSWSEERRVFWIAHLCDLTWRTLRCTTVALGGHIIDHVSILCVSSGSANEAEIVDGFAFHHARTSRRMPSHILNPRLLLLGGELSYPAQPFGDLIEYVSVYQGYLDKLVQRIEVWGADIIAVEGGMHHYMQDRLASLGICLLLHVGQSHMERLAACCSASIVRDLQYVGLAELCAMTPIGTCGEFESFCIKGDTSSVCVFRGLTRPLHSTVILRGAAMTDLLWLRGILRDALVAAYHVTIQQHLLLDLGLSLEKSPSMPQDVGPDHLHQFMRDGSSARAMCLSALTMNTGITYTNDIMQMEPDGIELMRDNLVVNTIFLNRLYNDTADNTSVAASTTSAAPVGVSTASGTLAAASYSVVQKHEALLFYRQSDKTLLGFLVDCFQRGGESRLIHVHGSSSVSVVTYIQKDGNQGRNAVSMTYTLCGAAEGRKRRYLVSQMDALLCSRSKLRYGIDTMPENLSHQRIPLPYCYVVCKVCGEEAVGWQRSRRDEVGLCSPHMLGLSFGALLEWLLYGASMCTRASCMHPLGPCFSLVFILYPDTAGSMVVELSVSPIPLYRLYMSSLGLPEGGPAVVGPTAATTAASDCTPAEPCDMFTMDVVGSTSLDINSFHADLARLHQWLLTVCQSLNVPSMEAAGGSEMVQSHESRAATSEADVIPTFLTLVQSHETSLSTLLERRGKHERDGESLRVVDAELRSLIHAFKRGFTEQLHRCEEVYGPQWCASLPFPAVVGENADSRLAAHHDQITLRLSEPTSIIAAACWCMQRNGQHVRCTTLEGPETGDAPAACVADVSPVRISMNVPVGTTTASTVDAESEDLTKGIDVLRVFTHDKLSFDLRPITSTGTALHTLEVKGGKFANEASPVSIKSVLPSPSPSASTTRAYSVATVESLYPMQFAAIHYLYTHGQPEVLLASLLRCRPYRTEGGKTNASFHMTMDGRLLLKRVKPAEWKHFVELGPRYFSHLHHLYRESQRGECQGSDEKKAVNTSVEGSSGASSCSALGKVLGMYSVILRVGKWTAPTADHAAETGTPTSGSSSQITTEVHYYVLMENVLYGRQADLLYDLKGSQRNRMAAPGAEVLLDMDLVEQLRRGRFFFCRNEDKRWLMDCISSDAYMLSAASIMDYSLMVGVDRSAEEIVVGLIDYLHPYSGVKVLESKVKAGLDTVFRLSGRDPTIIDPVNYRTRFLKWVDGYFCGVPDKAFTLKPVTTNDYRKQSQHLEGAGGPM